MRAVTLALLFVVGLATPASAARSECTRSLRPDKVDVTFEHLPPAQPQVESARFHSDGLVVVGTFSEDTHRIRVRYPIGGRNYELWTTPDKLDICTKDIPRHDTPVTIVAFDLFGNAADTITINAWVPYGRRCGLGPMMHFVASLAGAILLLAALKLVIALRRERRMRVPGVEIEASAARSMLLHTFDHTLMVLVAGASLAVILFVTHHYVATLLASYIPLSRALRLFALGGFLRRAQPGSLHGNLLVFGKDYVVLPRSADTSRGLPTATLTKRR